MSDKKILVGDMSRETAIGILKLMLEAMEVYDSIAPTPQRRNAVQMAIASLETDEAYQLEYESTTKDNLGVDCISRKAAEDITWQDPSYTDPLNILTEVRDKIRELPSVTPQEPRWIPVSEKLPEDDELYLVYTKEQPFVCPFKDGEFFIDEVIAWMPLPKAYKEVEEC